MANPEWDNYKTKTGIDLIAAERERQIKEEGWTPEHDAEHIEEELAWAAVHYAAPDGAEVHRVFSRLGTSRPAFPDTWDKKWDKKRRDGRIRDLARAGALMAAEIDRILVGVKGSM
jgi:hypothetical protein